MDLPTVADRLGVWRIAFVKWGHLLRFDPNDIDA
jgi:hypothetical protein